MAIVGVERDEDGRYRGVVVNHERFPDEPMMGAECFGGEKGFWNDLGRARDYVECELGEKFFEEVSLKEELLRRARGGEKVG